MDTPAFNFYTVPQSDIEAINNLCYIVNDWATKKGWNEDPIGDFLARNDAPNELQIALDILVKAQECALITSEVSERLEYARVKGDIPMDDHVPSLTGEEAEFADILIRIFHYCGKRGIDLGRAIHLKHAYNISRPYRHGKTI